MKLKKQSLNTFKVAFAYLLFRQLRKNKNDYRNDGNDDKNTHSHSEFKNTSYDFTTCKAD